MSGVSSINISNLIENYIKKLLQESADGLIEIQRSDLAEKFNCVPSQINYVLATRFTVERGFLVESRRGGRGYVRIIKLPVGRDLDLVTEAMQAIGDAISEHRARGIVLRLFEGRLISAREAALMQAAISRDVLRLGLPARDQLRAGILKAMLANLMREMRGSKN